ncbi:acetylglutamate kinase [Streptomyces sp. RTd22]|uniref:acetylglutamate kinase n=1 Tax=Streptomyces sp. RTd22 TaxID=1841249 RepID=UPI0007C4F267|nr:acetylglutamate kinase [Streptomyces sp. RTd22]
MTAPAAQALPAQPSAASGRKDRLTVIKLGGNAMADGELKASFADDVVRMHRAGLQPVVVHGGGPQISAELERHGLTATFRGGLRVTTPRAMGVVRMVLAGRVQRELVGLINRHGPMAVGMTGEDADTVTAVRHLPVIEGRPVDIGRVGQVSAVDTTLLRTLLADGRIPVVSPIARSADDDGIYNVNADTAAAALASALGAGELLLLTDVQGLYADWPDSHEVIERLTATELEALLPELSHGMTPKMAACLHAVRHGVGRARVLDGRVRHAALAGLRPDERSGTTVVPDATPSQIDRMAPHMAPHHSTCTYGSQGASDGRTGP